MIDTIATVAVIVATALAVAATAMVEFIVSVVVGINSVIASSVAMVGVIDACHDGTDQNEGSRNDARHDAGRGDGDDGSDQ